MLAFVSAISDNVMAMVQELKYVLTSPAGQAFLGFLSLSHNLFLKCALLSVIDRGATYNS